MEIEEIVLDSTVIKFFDDYVVESEKEIIERNFDIAVTNAMQKIIDTKKL